MVSFRLRPLYPRESTHVTHWIEARLSTRAKPDASKKYKYFSPDENWNMIRSASNIVTVLTELPRPQNRYRRNTHFGVKICVLFSFVRAEIPCFVCVFVSVCVCVCVCVCNKNSELLHYNYTVTTYTSHISINHYPSTSSFCNTWYQDRYGNIRYGVWSLRMGLAYFRYYVKWTQDYILAIVGMFLLSFILELISQFHIKSV
jgi:hypothetical protein